MSFPGARMLGIRGPATGIKKLGLMTGPENGPSATPAVTGPTHWITMSQNADPGTPTGAPAGSTYAMSTDTYTGSVIRGGLTFGCGGTAPGASNGDAGGSMGLWYLANRGIEQFIAKVGTAPIKLFLAHGHGAANYSSQFEIYDGNGSGGTLLYDTGVMANVINNHGDILGGSYPYNTYFASAGYKTLTAPSGIITIQRGTGSDAWLDGVGWA